MNEFWRESEISGLRAAEMTRSGRSGERLQQKAVTIKSKLMNFGQRMTAWSSPSPYSHHSPSSRWRMITFIIVPIDQNHPIGRCSSGQRAESKIHPPMLHNPPWSWWHRTDERESTQKQRLKWREGWWGWQRESTKRERREKRRSDRNSWQAERESKKIVSGACLRLVFLSYRVTRKAGSVTVSGPTRTSR